MPVGTANLIAGGNANVVEENYIFDNWRRGTMLHWVPAALRGEMDPGKTYDTSANNRYTRNCMGTRPFDLDERRLHAVRRHAGPNGVDFWWDEEEGQDCRGAAGLCRHRRDQRQLLGRQPGLRRESLLERPPALLLPNFPGLDAFRPGNTAKQATLVPCATRNPTDNTDPPGLRLVHAAATSNGCPTSRPDSAV